VHARLLQDIRHAEIVELPLPLLEEQDALVPRAVVVAHPDLTVVGDHAVGQQEEVIAISHRDIHQVDLASVLDRLDGYRLLRQVEVVDRALTNGPCQQHASGHELMRFDLLAIAQHELVLA